jgi:hypothetical protein
MASTARPKRRRLRLAVAGAVAVTALVAAPAGADPSGNAPAPPDPTGAFVVRDGRFTPLDTIPNAAVSGHVNSNNRGQVVGLYADAADAATAPPGQLPTIRSFVKDPRGPVTTFAVPGASATVATGINDRGQVAGTSFDAGVTFGDSPYPPGSVHGFIRQPDGRITTIDLPRFANTAVTDINDRGQLAGQNLEFVAERSLGFMREPDGRLRVIDLPGRGAVGSYLALNDRGQVVGQWDDRNQTPAKEPGTGHGFVWDRGRLTRFDVLRSLATGALGINNAGQISGSYDDAAGRHHGFVLGRGRYTTIDAPGRTVTDAWASTTAARSSSPTWAPV